ncbi:MAG: flippase-like domain-containing protein [Pirellulales bacterium]|nr:flippase-like domain-containing protein [Pirellulales bacterium]
MTRWLQKLRAWKRPLQATVALVLLAALYWAADWREVVSVIASLNPLYLLVAWALFVPQTAVSAWRWSRLVRPAADVPLRDAVRATLAAAAYNLLLPSKLGDVSKLSVVPSSRRKSGLLWLALEKGFDVAALLVLVILGLLGSGWLLLSAILLGLLAIGLLATGRLPGQLGRGWDRWSPVVLSSAVLWSLHMMQIDLFCKAAGVFVTGDFTLWRIPMAIFAGLVPFTLWGLGTRDAALVGLFSATAPAATMVTVGLLTATRYLIPGAVGIPFVISRSAERRVPATTAEPPSIDHGALTSING